MFVRSFIHSFIHFYKTLINVCLVIAMTHEDYQSLRAVEKTFNRSNKNLIVMTNTFFYNTFLHRIASLLRNNFHETMNIQMFFDIFFVFECQDSDLEQEIELEDLSKMTSLSQPLPYDQSRFHRPHH